MTIDLTVDWWPTPATTWTWAPVIHVGALLAALAPGALVVMAARLRGARVSRDARWLLAAATLTLLLTLHWPLGSIAQVSLTGRVLQYMLLTFVAAPLLLLGTPRWSAGGRSAPRRALERIVSAPWVGAIVLALAAWTTHTEVVVEQIEVEAAGHAAIRGVWFATAVLYWWPLLGPGPARERLSYFAGLGYLVLPFLFPKFPAAVWVFSTDPAYPRYEGVSNPWGWSALGDQGVAAFLLWLPGSVVVAVAIYLLLRHWVREDRRLALRQRLGVPADPEAVAALMAHPQAPELWSTVEALVDIVDEASPPRHGSDIAFAREGERIVLRLMAPVDEEDQQRLEAMIEAGYEAHLRRYPDTRREVIRRHLAVEVQAYGVRVR